MRERAEWIMGLGGSDHEFSCSLAASLDIRVAIEQERLSRRKHGFTLWYERPVQKSIDYCLQSEGIQITDVARIVSSDILPIRIRHELRHHRIELYSHHLCHAASAYMMLPIGATAGILVYDGYGSRLCKSAEYAYRDSRETFSFFVFRPNGYECIGCTSGAGFIDEDFPNIVTNSLGMLYELVTALLGSHSLDCGKTMGLAAFGTPRYVSELESFVSYGDDPYNCFTCSTDDPALAAKIEDILFAGRGSFAAKADVAASVQAIAEKTLVHCARFFCNREIDYLCISGGCGLNTVSNSSLIKRLDLHVPVVIPPHCGDSGIAFGALWLDHFMRFAEVPEFTFRGTSLSPNLSRPGRTYTSEECRQAALAYYPRLWLDKSVRSAADLAITLARGAVVGLFNGGSEIGPRALGGRSIIADPRAALTRERINRFLKHREPYRPLAPLVLTEDYDRYFVDHRMANEFMLKVCKATDECQREAPAVVHVDGTCRVQVVGPNGDTFLAELLEKFRAETGCGLLINTSFNRRGEPLVESPLDAVDAFLGMGLDGLYLQGEYYRPAPQSPNT